MPAAVSVSPPTRTFTTVGATERFTVTVTDQKGQSITPVGVVWSTSDRAIATVNDSGTVTAVRSGATTITASLGAVKGAAAVTVAPASTPLPGPQPTQLTACDGGDQTAPILEQLPSPVVACVYGAANEPVAGVRVNFAVTADGGGGSVGTATATTDSAGKARTTWRLGQRAGRQDVTAGVGSYVVGFTAQALPLAPDSVAKHSPDATNVPAHTAVTPAPSVLVTDRYGNPVDGVRVTFRISRGNGQLTDSVRTTVAGVASVGQWIVDTTAIQEVTAVASPESLRGDPITFRATVVRPGGATRLVALSEPNQTGMQGYPVNSPPAVRLVDEANRPVWGVVVRFAVTSGGGSVTGDSVTTDLEGFARAGSWTIGSGANTLTARAAGVATPVTFQATGVPSTFTVVVRYLPAVDGATRAVIDSAAARWSRVIYGDVPDVPVNLPTGGCSNALMPALNETVDDILIYVIVEPIDGAGKVLSTGTPCVLRDGSLLPAIAVLRVDSDDVARLEEQSMLRGVALHTMAHALGFGTLWPAKGLVTGAGGDDPRFTGANASAAYRAISGGAYTQDYRPPLESHVDYNDPVEDVAGARDVHWRSLFGIELMTAYARSVFRLSSVTAAQFGDLGYQVNLGAADDFTCGPPLQGTAPCDFLRAAPEAVVPLVGDVQSGPVLVVDRSGAVVRTLQLR